MQLPKYPHTKKITESFYQQYEFESYGRKGWIKKIVRFDEIGNNI